MTLKILITWWKMQRKKSFCISRFVVVDIFEVAYVKLLSCAVDKIRKLKYTIYNPF